METFPTLCEIDRLQSQVSIANLSQVATLCLVCLIHASLNGRSQVTFPLWDTIVFRRYQHTELSCFVQRRSNASFVTWHRNTGHCVEFLNTTSSYWLAKSQSCPLQNTIISVHKYLWKLCFIIKREGSFLLF